MFEIQQSMCSTTEEGVLFSRASSEKFIPSAEDLPGAFEHIEGEIDDLDDVIAGHSDFCALVASRGTAAAFRKSGCEHGKIINRPNFSLSPAILDDIPNLARRLVTKPETILSW
jgi:hypothetical protein